ncbi:MAG: hypothetical protein ACI8RZ_003090 [Myxococcota bacterium]|jgi:hypothetical protein
MRAALLAGLALVVLAAWPLRDALLTSTVPGAGPDVVSTLWGMWWFSEVGPLDAMGSQTDLVNFPYGATGSVLSPSSALLWTLLAPLLGAARAASAAALLQIAGLAAGCAWLTRRLTDSRWGAAAAGLVVLAARYLPFGVGEGSAVAVAALPIPLGLLALRAGGWTGGLLAALCMAWVAAENPYLAPVLPGVAVLMALDATHRRTPVAPLLLAVVLGSVGIVVIAGMFSGSASPDYPREVAGQTVALAGAHLSVVDLPWARAGLSELVWPGAVRWTLSAQEATAATGGRYLGLVGLLLTGAAMALRPRQSLPWLGLIGVGVALSLGSITGGIAGPFLFLNALMDAVARPLTQPTRFLALAVIGMSVCAGIAVTAVVQRWGSRAGVVLLGVVLLDGLLVGGLSLRLPTTALPSGACLADLEPGGLLMWPWDAELGELSDTQLYQIIHGHPSPQTGIASWALSQEGRVLTPLRGSGWSTDPTRRRLNLTKLVNLGYRWGVVEVDADPDGAAWLASSLGQPFSECDGLIIYDLAAAASTRKSDQTKNRQGAGLGADQGGVPGGGRQQGSPPRQGVDPGGR